MQNLCSGNYKSLVEEMWGQGVPSRISTNRNMNMIMRYQDQIVTHKGINLTSQT